MDDTGKTPQGDEPAQSGTPDPAGGPVEALKSRVIEALREVYDPEIPVNIYEMGLIYDVTVSPQGDVGIQMTLTTPNCPVAEWLPSQVQARAREVEGVSDVYLDLVWEPPWTPDMMSEAARLELGMM